MRQAVTMYYIYLYMVSFLVALVECHWTLVSLYIISTGCGCSNFNSIYNSSNYFDLVPWVLHIYGPIIDCVQITVLGYVLVLVDGFLVFLTVSHIYLNQDKPHGESHSRDFVHLENV